MGPPTRVRYNSKARGPHKKRKLNRKPPPKAEDAGEASNLQSSAKGNLSNDEGTENLDSRSQIDYLDPSLNVEIIVPKTVAQKEQDRKERMMQEVSHWPHSSHDSCV